MTKDIVFPDTELVTVRLTAMNVLARREHSIAELNKKLTGKGFSTEAIEKVVTDLRNENLLSDERFAESYIRLRSGKGFGPMRIRQELKERGIGENIIENYLYQEDKLWCVRMAEVREKRFGRLLPKDYKNKAKQMRFLQYRGFTNEQLAGLFNDTY